MSNSRLLDNLRHALRVLTDADDDEHSVDAWDRLAVFRLDAPETQAFQGTPCADAPPEAFLLMVREGSPKAYELLWRHSPSTPFDACPVVELTSDGEVQALAATPADYVSALIYSCGALGGGTEEDLIAAREDADPAAIDLADTLADELDLDLDDPESLGERFDDAQAEWSDPWYEAVEALD